VEVKLGKISRCAVLGKSMPMYPCRPTCNAGNDTVPIVMWRDEYALY